MADHDLNHIRQQQLKRALSIIVRSSEFDSVTACSLDILCNVGILYMQSMFAQVHAYAEHATRTRPNLNDVGRALEERNVSVAQLDTYHRSEAELRLDPSISAAMAVLHRQTDFLATDSPAAACLLGESRLFFDSKAEDLLRRLVASHKSSVEEQRRKEQAIQSAVTAASNHAGVGLEPAISSLDNSIATMHLTGTGAANAGRHVRRHTSGMMGDDDDDDDDEDEDEEDDDEGEEDADFEAPATSVMHTNPSIAIENTDMYDPHQPQLPRQIAAGGNDNDRPGQSGTMRIAETEPAIEEEPGLAGYPVDDVERFLLPTLVLPEHIPTQCPPFPSPHTYKQTPVLPEREQDFFRNRMHKAEQSRQAEENLQRLINGPRRDHHSSLPTDDDTQVLAIASDVATGEGVQNKQVARKRLEKLFPPANFRSTYKRTGLAGYIK
ncbi:transcription initiation factor TFIID subunit 8 [Coemansia aciculifera]|uniref:Transcription initiation factor TFIID subunit 8 n=1 Tax=Coemansia aciculifera TaxID=417176 RepID=A0A9W8IK97_9FUNG|nr:transcription initiation factor TFIID subunit 8 [Coemansia aciculifera]KAJ2871913.1 transcription initiation factor TFIID subunit 8 [Coemansia aciculifera]